MKNFLLSLTIAILIAGCGDVTSSTTNQITEVGNPTSGATTSGVTKALTNSMAALPEATSESFGPSLVTGENFAITTDDGFVCSFDRDTRIETCTCPGGGSLTHTFDASFSRESGTITFAANSATNFSDCVVTTCGDTDVTIDGASAGDIDGSFAVLAGTGAVSADFATTESCAGITANDDTLGYDLTVDVEDGAATIQGVLCLNDTSYTFTSLAELQEDVDPDDECGEDF